MERLRSFLKEIRNDALEMPEDKLLEMAIKTAGTQSLFPFSFFPLVFVIIF